MEILYLYTEVMPYMIPVFRELVSAHGARVHVVHWDSDKLTPYSAPEVDGVHYYRRSEYPDSRLAELTENVQPDLVYISGWQDRGYLPAAAALRKSGKPIVAGFDDLWTGSMRQIAGSLLLRAGFRRRYFTHAWVAGPFQYEYARKMGFAKREIIFDLLSGDTSIFEQASAALQVKLDAYPKTFLYVGNFRNVKGTDILAQAYRIYRERHRGDWRLLTVGNGPLRSCLVGESGVEVREFADQEELVDLARNTGAFILPSRLDKWGVVVHEFAAAGLPLILSENVGAHAVFLIDGYNGYRFRDNSPEELARRMRELSDTPAEKLVAMGRRSYRLSKIINPSMCAANLLSAVR